MDNHDFIHRAYGLRRDGTIGPETDDNPVMTMTEAMAKWRDVTEDPDEPPALVLTAELIRRLQDHMLELFLKCDDEKS